jgi:Dna[CI] antecedent, DciA
MSSDGPRSLADVLRTGDIARLQSQAADRRKLAEATRASLPHELAEHLLSASFDANGDLVLSMDSPVWAAKVRYAYQELDGKRIRVRVLPRSGR